MKKSSVFTLICTLLLTIFLFACDKEPSSDTQKPTESTTETITTENTLASEPTTADFKDNSYR